MFPMRVIYFILFIVFTFGDNSCDQNGILIYEDLKCTPEYRDSKQCAFKYSCPALNQPKDKCSLDGKMYNEGEEVGTDLSTCNSVCTCTNEGFTCLTTDCPDFIPPPECHRGYTSVDECCDDQLCPPFDENVKCLADGKTYEQGEEFYPDGTCKRCVCQKGFQGKFEEPFCQRIRCALELDNIPELRKASAPIYIKKNQNATLCCPDDWLNPEKQIFPGFDPDADVSINETCKFGEYKVALNRHFIIEKEKITCSCDVPPLLKCVKG